MLCSNWPKVRNLQPGILKAVGPQAEDELGVPYPSVLNVFFVPDGFAEGAGFESSWLAVGIHTQYGHYLWQLARGDFGQSFKFQAPVCRVIFERYPATLQLAFLALVVCAAIAIPSGMLAAYRRGQTPDCAVGGCARSE